MTDTVTDGLISGDMLSRVRAVDPDADADAVKRYANEIAEAYAKVQSLVVDFELDPPAPNFSPNWGDGQSP